MAQKAGQKDEGGKHVSGIFRPADRVPEGCAGI